MTNFYIAPLQIIDNTAKGGSLYRFAPLFAHPRLEVDGIAGQHSVTDFGSKNPHCLLTTADPIPLLTSDIYAFTDDLMKAPEVGEKDAILGFLTDIGVEGNWVKEGLSHREILHRLFGMSQVMQSAEDDPYTVPEKQDPAEWLSKEIYLGSLTLGAIDQKGFMLRQAESDTTNWVQEGNKFRNVITGEEILISVARDKFGGGGMAGGKNFWKYIALAPLLILMGALPATDVFTNTDGTYLESHNANWGNHCEISAERMSINTNSLTVSGVGGQNKIYGWQGDAFNDNQYSKATVTSVATFSWIGVSCRVSNSAVTTYNYYGDGGTDSQLSKFVAGTETTLGTGAAFTASLSIEIRADGTTITPRRAGATADIGAKTDSSISSGNAGVCGYGASTSAREDDWEGGNLSAATRRMFQRASVLG